MRIFDWRRRRRDIALAIKAHERRGAGAAAALETTYRHVLQALQRLDGLRRDMYDGQYLRFCRLCAYDDDERDAQPAPVLPRWHVPPCTYGPMTTFRGLRSLGLSILAGSVAALGVVKVTIALGTAGTGRALSHLYGLPRVTATLAALGGGPVAKGGFGMTGGLVVLILAFVVPAVVVGGLLIYRGLRRDEEAARAYGEAMDGYVAHLTAREAYYQRHLQYLYDMSYEMKTMIPLLDAFLAWYACHAVSGLDGRREDIVARAFDLCQHVVTMPLEELPAPERLAAVHDQFEAIKRDFYHHQSEEMAYILEAYRRSESERTVTKILQDKDIRSYFKNALAVARRELCITSPWMNRHVVNDYLIGRMEQLLQRGVTIRIVYGIESRGKPTGADLRRRDETNRVAAMLTERFASYGERFRMKRSNTHAKLLICDDWFYIIGSYNFLSFDGRYDSASTRRELGEYREDKKMIRLYKKACFQF